MDRDDRLIGLYTRVYSRPRAVTALKLLGVFAVMYVVLSFIAVNARLLIEREYMECVRLCTVSAVPFLAVSVMRILFDAKRPYEKIDFAPFEIMREKRKSGRSFPSRHVFSAFLLGTLLLCYNIPLGIISLIIGILLSVERVLLGIHFTGDVVVGGIIGIVSGVIGILFL